MSKTTKNIDTYDRLMLRTSQLKECEKRIDELEADHVSKKALRKWCEEKLKKLSILSSMDPYYFEKFSTELLDQFCKEGE